jgi:hypothetical protein
VDIFEGCRSGSGSETSEKDPTRPPGENKQERRIHMNLAGSAKMIVFIIIGLFIFKLASGWLSKKWPNVVTSSIDKVVQTA